MIPQITTSPEKLPLLVVPDDVLLPGSTIRIEVFTVENINLVRSCMTLGISVVGVITKDPNKKRNVNGLHEIGTAGILIPLPCTSSPRPTYTVLVTGLCRFKLVSVIQEHPYLVGSVVQLDDIRSLDSKNEVQLTELVVEFQKAAQRWLELLDVSVPAVAMLKVSLEQLPIQKLSLFQEILKQVPVELLPDMFASLLRTTTLQERLKVLDAIDLSKRFRITLNLLLRRIQRLEEDQKTSGEEINNNNPETDLKPFKDTVDDITELDIKIVKANMPEHARKAVVKELGQLKQMAQHMPEYSILRKYLDLVVNLPWSISVKETCNISKARADLDADHFGLEKVKRRILSYLSIRQLKGRLKTRLLCIVGSPGVCKTSIVKSIAKTLGRPYHLISLNGVSDQHYIRGQRRTNIDSMPGRVIQGLRTVKVNNPVMLLDEIDKMGTGIHGDLTAALLEVLDPEQNSSFTDTYLKLPFDLSQVLFVVTANNLDDVPTALLDLMIVVNVPDYTHAEKIILASRQIIPKQLEEHGLSADIVDIPLDIIFDIVESYTDEAGVTTLEHKIGTVCRVMAVVVVILAISSGAKEDSNVMKVERLENTELPPKQEKNIQDDDEEHSQHLHPVSTWQILNVTHLRESMELPITVDSQMLQAILGPPIFQSNLDAPGMAVGFSCSTNIETLCVVRASNSTGEASNLTGEASNLTGEASPLTGQRRSVIEESAAIAWSWIRQHLTWLGFDEDKMKDCTDYEILTFNDDPSVGVTLLTAFVSLLTDRCVRPDVAMTGEITLKGVVLRVRGISEKIMCAYRAGKTTVILPQANKSDLADIPTSVLDKMEMVFVYSVEQVLEAAF